MTRKLVGPLLLLALLLTASTAQAQYVRKGTRGYIEKGVFELGIDNFLLYRTDSVTDPEVEGQPESSRTSTTAIWTGGFTPRFFVMRNLAVSANINYWLENRGTTTKLGDDESTVESSDKGFLFVGMVHYYVHLAGDMFFKPGVGGGYFMGTRSVPDPTDANRKIESDLSGGVAKVDLGLVYYAGEHFNIKAGPELLVRFGSESPKDPAEGEPDEGPSFTTIDATFAVGIGWSF